MRYTPIIDITTIPELWGNNNIVRLYYYMAMVAGYHAQDMDIVDISIRTLALRVGITVSATRNALRQLAKYHLITRQGNLWKVMKVIPGQTYTKRKKQPTTEQQAAERQREQLITAQAEERARHDAEMQSYRDKGTNALEVYLEDLKRRAEAGDPEAIPIWNRRAKDYQALQEQRAAARAALANIKSNGKN